MLISHTGNKPAFHPTKHVPDRDQALICCLRIEFPDFPRLAHSYSALPVMLERWRVSPASSHQE